MRLKKYLKRIFKWLLRLLLALLFLITILIFMLQYAFPSGLVKSQIISYLKEYYDINASIGKLDFSVLSGIEIADLSVGIDNAPPISNFGTLRLGYKVIPFLLDNEIIVNEVTLKDFSADIIKENGKFNFENLIEKFSSGETKKETPEEVPEEESEESSTKLIVDINKVNIVNLSGKYIDKDTNLNAYLSGFNLSVSNFKIDGDNFSGDVKLSIKSDKHISFSDSNMSISLIPDLNIDANLKNDVITSKIGIILDDILFEMGDIKELPDSPLKLNIDGNYNLATSKAQLKNLNLDYSPLLSLFISGGATLGDNMIANVSELNLKSDLYQGIIYAKKNKIQIPDDISLNKLDLALNLKDVLYNSETNILNSDLTLDLEGDNIIYLMGNDTISLGKLEESIISKIEMKDFKISDNQIKNALVLRDISLPQSFKIGDIPELDLELKSSLKQDFMPKFVDLEIFIQDILSGSCGIELHSDLSKADLTAPIDKLLKKLKANLKIQLNDIEFTENEMYAKLNSNSLELNLSNGRADFANNLLLGSFELNSDSLQASLGNTNLALSSKFDLTQFGKNEITTENFQLQLDDVLSFSIDNITTNLNTQKNDITNLALNLSVENLLDKANGVSLVTQLNPEANGEINFELSGTLTPEPLYYDFSGKEEIRLSKASFQELREIADITLNHNFTLNSNTGANLAGNISVDNLNTLALTGTDYPELSSVSINKNISTNSTFDKFDITNLDIAVNNLDFLLNLNGDASLKDKMAGSVNIEMELPLKKNYSFIEGIDFNSGLYKNEIVARLDKNQNINYSLKNYINGLNIYMPLDSTKTQFVDINNLNLKLPLEGSLNLETMKFTNNELYTPEKTKLTEYIKKRNSNELDKDKINNLTIDTVQIKSGKIETSIKNLFADLSIKNSNLNLHALYFDILQGNFLASLDVGLKNPDLKDDVMKNITIDMHTIISGINTKALLNPEDTKTTTGLNVNAKLFSDGLDIINEPKLEGDISITRLSDDDTFALLDFLAKGTQDSSIGLLKNTLTLFPNIKVNLFSFRIKNNFIYTLVKLYKPWYLFYFPLSEEISFTKQSLRFYIEKFTRE